MARRLCLLDDAEPVLEVERLKALDQEVAEGTLVDTSYRDVVPEPPGETEEEHPEQTPEYSDESVSEDPLSDSEGEAVDETKECDGSPEMALEACLEHHANSLGELIALRHGVSTEDFSEQVKTALNLGYQYSAFAVKHLYKGITYALNKTLLGLVKGAEAISRYVRKREINGKRILAQLNALKERAEALKESEAIAKSDNPMLYAPVADALKIGSSGDVLKNIAIVEAFVKQHYEYTTLHSASLANAILRVIRDVEAGRTPLPDQLVLGLSNLPGYKLKTISGHTPKVEHLLSYCYEQTLPGDRLAIAYLADTKVKDYEDALPAYKASRFFIGLDQAALNQPAILTTLTIDRILALIQILIAVVRLWYQYRARQLNVLSLRSQLTSGLKTYLDVLLKRKDKISIHESMVEVIAPAVDFLDKLYISSTLQVDDYLLQLVKKAAQYTSLMLDQYKAP